uniref:Transposase n=1 Tax=Acrobeloides nanus TaxID=290746 RepID=A0A914DTD3_9BILA
MNEFRGDIIRMFEQGKSGYQIAQDMNLHARTINRIIKSGSKGMERHAIPQDIIDKAVDDFSKRLKKCIEAGGGHFENK